MSKPMMKSISVETVLSAMKDQSEYNCASLRDALQAPKGYPMSQRMEIIVKNGFADLISKTPANTFMITDAGLEHLEKNLHMVQGTAEINHVPPADLFEDQEPLSNVAAVIKETEELGNALRTVRRMLIEAMMKT